MPRKKLLMYETKVAISIFNKHTHTHTQKEGCLTPTRIFVDNGNNKEDIFRNFQENYFAY